MKKLSAILMVLGVTALTFGATISIDAPSSVVYNTHADVDLTGFVQASTGEAVSGFLIAQGPGTLTGGTLMAGDGGLTEFAPGDDAGGITWADFLAGYGWTGISTNIIMVELFDSAPPFEDLSGLLVDNVDFYCEGEGYVTLSFLTYNQDYTQLNAIASCVIEQIPEPITVALLGLGGLFLRRRIAK